MSHANDAPVEFAVSWDYRCPFARNAHEHVLTALESGTDWHVNFTAFSLDQSHAEEGTSVFDDPDRHPGLLANQVGIVVRDLQPTEFRQLHRALFAARHDRSLDIRRRDILAQVMKDEGVDPSYVFGEIEQGWPLKAFRSEHEAAVADYQMFGVPTFVLGGRAAFVRLTTRPLGNGAYATEAIDRILSTLGAWPELNELKHTKLSN
jgi:hypothetical protein